MPTALSLLGPVEAVADGRRLDLGGPQQRALLALLALRAGQVVPVEVVVDALWPADPPRSADKVVQTYVSRLRRVLGQEAIERRGHGYILRVARDDVDVCRCEALAEAGRLRDALALWRGPALADVVDVGALRLEAERLEELRLRVLEARIEADLLAGGHGDVVAELRSLVAAHPLRERLRALLMLALYGSGRQAESLDAYREGRRMLVEQLGIEPGEQLRELHARILRQDAALGGAATAPADAGSVIVWCSTGGEASALVELGATLAADRELIVADLVDRPGDVGAASSALEGLRELLVARGVAARTVAFTSRDPGGDIARLAADQNARLVLALCPPELLADGTVPAAVARALEHAPCDVALVSTRSERPTGPVAVPFGAADHDWAAVEVGAWLAAATGARMRLVGSESSSSGRDASRTLATASLLLQRHLGVAAEPVLAPPGERGVLAAFRDAAVVVAGLPDAWARSGIGAARLALVREAAAPVVLVRHGERPGGLAPPGAVTRFSWSRAG